MSNADQQADAPSAGDKPAAKESADPTSPVSLAATRVGEAGESAYTVMGLEAAGDSTSADRHVGGKIGKYEIRALLGQGGMGAVYLAFDPLIEREVALKILSPEVGGNAAALQRFLGEARAIGRLNSPHVVAVYDIDQWEGQYFIVMELLSGGSVAQLSEERGPLPWKLACQIVLEAARGLQSAHDAGMIHRDIKPENLMLTKEGTVKVVDFGLSKLVDATQDTRTAVTRAGQILGTPQYMSPEQFESADVDARTDIYSLGGTLFRLLTGRFPYHDCGTIVQVMSAHIHQPPPVPTQFVKGIPEACDTIVARAMMKKLSDRYQSAGKLSADLQTLVHLDPSRAGPGAGDADQERELQSVLIVEPSKLQGAVLKDGLARGGYITVQSLGRMAEAAQAVEQQAPDLLITAMELPDGRGIDLLRKLSEAGRLKRTTAVLNTSESPLDELASLRSIPCTVLAPKKAKADEIQRVIHAASALSTGGGMFPLEFDPSSVSVRIVLDAGDLPRMLTDLVRQSKLLNVDVVIRKAVDAASHPLPDLTLVVQTLATAAVDQVAFARLASAEAECSGLAAAVQAHREGLTIRAVARGGIVALTQRPLHWERLKRLLQSCRN